MMPEEWPIAAEAAQIHAPARSSAGDRLATVRADFFLDPSKRLTEQERALMTAMLHCLVDDVAAALRAALPAGGVPANDGSDLAIVDLASGSRLFDEPVLMAMLLRSADEERISVGATVRTGHREARVLQGLVSHENGEVSAAAMALILARGRRRDRFGQCLLAFDDLPRAAAETLVHRVAAGVRNSLPDSPAIDADIGRAMTQAIAGHEPAKSIDTCFARLVGELDRANALDDELIIAAAHEGEIAFVGHMLARRASIPSDIAIDELLSGDEARIVALFQIAGATRALSAGVLAGIGDLLGISDPARAIGRFDSATVEEIAAARAWLATPPAYRSALAMLGGRNG